MADYKNDEAPKVLNVGIWSLAVVGALAFAVSVGGLVSGWMGLPEISASDPGVTTVGKIGEQRTLIQPNGATGAAAIPTISAKVAINDYPGLELINADKGEAGFKHYYLTKNKKGDMWHCSEIIVPGVDPSKPLADAANQEAIRKYLTDATVGGEKLEIFDNSNQWADRFGEALTKGEKMPYSVNLSAVKEECEGVKDATSTDYPPIKVKSTTSAAVGTGTGTETGAEVEVKPVRPNSTPEEVKKKIDTYIAARPELAKPEAATSIGDAGDPRKIRYAPVPDSYYTGDTASTPKDGEFVYNGNSYKKEGNKVYVKKDGKWVYERNVGSDAKDVAVPTEKSGIAPNRDLDYAILKKLADGRGLTNQEILYARENELFQAALYHAQKNARPVTQKVLDYIKDQTIDNPLMGDYLKIAGANIALMPVQGVMSYLGTRSTGAVGSAGYIGSEANVGANVATRTGIIQRGANAVKGAWNKVFGRAPQEPQFIGSEANVAGNTVKAPSLVQRGSAWLKRSWNRVTGRTPQAPKFVGSEANVQAAKVAKPPTITQRVGGAIKRGYTGAVNGVKAVGNWARNGAVKVGNFLSGWIR